MSLETLVEFGTPDLLWNIHSIGKYLDDPCVCKNGMVQDKFDLIRRCMRLRNKKKDHLCEIIYEAWQWTFLDELVEKINNIHKYILYPYDIICVKDIISC